MQFAFVLWLALSQVTPTEAPVGFDNLTNGFTSQEEFEADRAVFAAREQTGIVFNHNSCAACHFNPVDGGSAPGIAELVTGRFANGVFSQFSLVHLASTNGIAQEKIDPAKNVRVRRRSRSLFGAAYVECLSNKVLQANTARSVLNGQRGQLTVVTLTEAPGVSRIGRFGWKAIQGSIQSFTAGASAAEIGEIRDVNDEDILAETRFQRSLKAPPRRLDLINDPDVIAGEAIFKRIGCAICHTPTFVTAPAGTEINGGKFVVPEALGSKIIHPFSDFALWDVATGDGIVHDGQPQNTRNKVATKALWGLGAEPLLLHDGRAITPQEAILLHGNQAASATAAFRRLPDAQKNQLLAFLLSL